MIDLIKKAVFTGMGVVSLTKEKIDDFSRELIDKGKLSEQEGEKIVFEMRKKVEESKEELKDQIGKVVETTLSSMHLAKKSELDALRSEIAVLRQEVDALRNKES